MSEFLSSGRNRILAAAIAFVVVVLAAGGGYYVWSQSKTGSGQQVASLAEAGVCKAAVARARDYGVLPPDAAKTGERNEDANNPSRVTCNAQASNGTFKLVADVACDDANKSECLILQKVMSSSGTALFDAQNI